MKQSVIRITFILCFLIVWTNSYCQEIDMATLNSSIKEADKIINTDTRIFFKNIRSFIVSKNGTIIHEAYYNGQHKDSIRTVQSETKSITAILLGIAVNKGCIANEEELISKYFPEYFDKNDALKSSIRLKDVLTMSAGFKWEELDIPITDPENDNYKMYNSGKWLNYVLSRPMACKPFTQFEYNSGCPMIIAAIIEKVSKMKLEKFAEKYLFGPLGIIKYRWIKDSTGLVHAGGGLRLKPSDMIKIGELVLNRGKWKNKQLFSENWTDKISQPYFVTTLGGQSYGYFTWIKEMKIGNNKTTKVVSFQGAGGQHTYIFPEYNLIAGFTEDNYNNLLVSSMILPNVILPALK